jgi:hypothetical protein
MPNLSDRSVTIKPLFPGLFNYSESTANSGYCFFYGLFNATVSAAGLQKHNLNLLTLNKTQSPLTCLWRMAESTSVHVT